MKKPKRKIGFVLECNRDGAEHKILEHVLERSFRDVEPVFRFQINKGNLFRDCGKVVEALFEIDACSQVFVVWDLWPCDSRFLDQGKPSCVKERRHLLGELPLRAQAKTVLVCVTYEVEAWLLVDGRALEAVLSTQSRKAKNISDDKSPERHKAPKEILDKIFTNNGKSRGYEHVVHAGKIIAAADLNKIARKAPSFQRLLAKLSP